MSPKQGVAHLSPCRSCRSSAPLARQTEDTAISTGAHACACSSYQGPASAWRGSPEFDMSQNTINSPCKLGTISFSLDTQQSHSHEINDSAFTPQGAPWQQFTGTINQPSRLLGQGHHEKHLVYSVHNHCHHTCTFSGRSPRQHTTSTCLYTDTDMYIFL